jgi:hypothetical protein
MKTIASKRFPMVAGLALTMLAAVPDKIRADGSADRIPTVVAVTGQSDWSLIPIDPKYITADEDGITIRRMPLAGLFTLSGDGLSLDAIIKGMLNADLDLTGTGSIYGPLVLTQKLRGQGRSDLRRPLLRSHRCLACLRADTAPWTWPLCRSDEEMTLPYKAGSRHEQITTLSKAN